jgi:hypothetical protein
MAKRPCRLAAISVMTFLSFCGPAWAQTIDAVDAHAKALLNLPSSPLVISATPNGRYLIAENYSRGTVNEYQAGCVTEELGKVTIKTVFKAVKGDVPLPSNDKRWFSGMDLRDMDSCTEKNAKLAVIRVSFVDGSEWRIKP